MIYNEQRFVVERDCVMRLFTRELADYCEPFSCSDHDLDEFFQEDAFYYDSELIGKTYAWIDMANPSQIVCLVTLANDSVKAKSLVNSARNRLQRTVTHPKHGMNYPAVLIGRLGVSSHYRAKGYNVGSQIIEFLKGWFRTEDNKTGCRFMVVDAYNCDRTIRFYQKNGFKILFTDENDERKFLGLKEDEQLETRFMFFDLKRK